MLLGVNKIYTTEYIFIVYLNQRKYISIKSISVKIENLLKGWR